jgi:hypothetical protein
MRRLVFLLAFGCSGNSLPVDNNSTAGTTAGTNGSTTAGSTTAGTNGSTTAGSTTAGSTTAGTNGSTTAGSTTAGTNGTTGTTNGGTTNGGPPGAACKTACDCMLGLACFQNMCVKSPMGMLYCCDSSSCPSGQFCQGSDGSFAMCGSTTGMGGGCKTACDCPTGQACFNGGCVMPPTGQLYCCDNGSCPASGGFCQGSDGSFGQCGGGTNGGPAPFDAGVNSCSTISCMSNSECLMNGCFNGCSQNRHVCR